MKAYNALRQEGARELIIACLMASIWLWISTPLTSNYLQQYLNLSYSDCSFLIVELFSVQQHMICWTIPYSSQVKQVLDWKYQRRYT